MWLSQCARILCVCQEPQTARRKAVCVSVTHAFMPASTHPHTRHQMRLFLHFTVFTENLSEAQQEGRKPTSLTIKLATKKPDIQPFTTEKMQREKHVPSEATAPPHLSAALTWRRPVIQRWPPGEVSTSSVRWRLAGGWESRCARVLLSSTCQESGGLSMCVCVCVCLSVLRERMNGWETNGDREREGESGSKRENLPVRRESMSGGWSWLRLYHNFFCSPKKAEAHVAHTQRRKSIESTHPPASPTLAPPSPYTHTSQINRLSSRLSCAFSPHFLSSHFCGSEDGSLSCCLASPPPPSPFSRS